MKIFIFLIFILLGLNPVETVRHGLQYIFTGSSGVDQFPQFVAVGLLDGVVFTSYDCDIRRETPKQEWIKKSENAEYWKYQTEKSFGEEKQFRVHLEHVKREFNHSGGVHVLQRTFGCDWDEETGEVNGYDRYGYDGEDFITLDVKTQTWNAARQEALWTTEMWNSKSPDYRQIYVTHICPAVLQKHVSSANLSLLRKEFPTVSLLQRTPSSGLSCHATGFYPHTAQMFWTRDDEQLHHDVIQGEILPNNDGTFQMSVYLNVSSFEAENWERFSCVFQFSADQSVTVRLDQRKIRSNWKESIRSHYAAVAAVAVFVFCLVVAAAVVVVVVGLTRLHWFKSRLQEEREKASPDEQRAVIELENLMNEKVQTIDET